MFINSVAALADPRYQVTPTALEIAAAGTAAIFPSSADQKHITIRTRQPLRETELPDGAISTNPVRCQTPAEGRFEPTAALMSRDLLVRYLVISDAILTLSSMNGHTNSLSAHDSTPAKWQLYGN